MLKKLLKYDTRALIRYWWIIAVVIVGATGVDIACTLFYNQYAYTDNYELLVGIAHLVSLLCNGLTLYSLSATSLILYIRFYTNFYTDQGYLTFTLPVKRSTLLASKTIHAFVWELIHLLLVAVCKIALWIITRNELFESFIEWLAEAWADIGALLIVYVILACIFLIIYLLFSIAIVHLCITLGAIIVKKAKVFASIGIYYAMNTVINIAIIGQLVLVIATLISAPTIVGSFTEFEIHTMAVLAACMLILMMLAYTALVYFITLSCMERKLNLS